MAEESVADDLLRNGYERWLRLEAEKDAIGDDLKELFAEFKSRGFAPKALRESFRRVRNINDADQQEHDAIVDLYVASLTGARPAPAHARENIEKFDPETDEIHSASPKADTAAGLPPSEGPAANNSTQEGSEPIEAHNLDSAGSTPAPATQSTGQRPTEASHVASVDGREIGEVGGGTRAFPPVDTATGMPGEAPAFPALPATNVTPIRQPHINLDCQKQAKGEDCRFADKDYSCSACQALASQNQQSARRA